jgi:hypothetical protein
MFRMKGAYLTNERGKVMWVQGDVDAEQRYIYSKTKKNHVSQQWDIIYADQWKREPKKGELNKRFCLYVERDFHVVTRLRSGRYLDLLPNRRFYLKTRNGRNTQKFWFDQRTLTIKSRNWTSYSWNIVSNGGAKDMEVTTTNSSYWW